jgi:hypothetical protein
MVKRKHSFGKKLVSELYSLRANDEYKAEMKKLEKKYNPPSDCEIIDGKEEIEFMKNPKFIEYMKESLGVIEKHNKELVIGNLVSYLADKGHLVEIMKGGKVAIDLEEMKDYLLSRSGIKITDKNKTYTTITIPLDATAKEVQRYWSENRRLQGMERKRRKESKNEERDYEILRLKFAGKKAREIRDIINADPRFANKKIAYQDVSVIIKRLKDKAKSITHKDS